MPLLRFLALLFVLAASIAVPASAAGEGDRDPLRFFEGRTESISTVKVILKKPYRSHAIGTGTIKPDGSLVLVQRVEGEGAPRTRRWHIRRVAPGRFVGTMSEATGPVKIEEVDGRYRFRFKMKGGLSIEQWLTPSADGRSASNRVTVKKFGLKVGNSSGTIRKTS